MSRAKTFIISLFFLLASAPDAVYCQEELLIGISPEENIFKQMEKYNLLADYLFTKTGIKMRLTILSKYGDIIDGFVSRKMDGAFFEGFTAILAMDKLSVEPLARFININGKSTIQSYVFVRKDSGIKGVKDMMGKRMAFIDRATVTGYLFAVALLKDSGVKDLDKYLKEYYFTGSHESVVFSVLDYRADIGTVKGRFYETLSEKHPSVRDELTVIAKSPEFPETTFFIKNDLPVGVKAKIKETLLAMDKDPEGVNILKKMEIKGFADTAKGDFMSVYEFANKAGINIKTYKYR